MNVSTVALLSFAVIGSVELIKRLFAKDWQASAIIATSALVGAVLGTQLGTTWIIGMVTGLQGSGIITTASYINNTVVPAVLGK